MVDTVKPPKSGRAAKAPAPRAKTPTLPKTGQSSLPIFVIGIASVLLVSLGVALYLWWAPVINAAVQVWEALRYTYVALAVWLVAFPVTLNRRSDLVKRFPHYWASALLMVPVVAGCLQLSGQGLGGEFGGWIVGSSATWGIVRTGAIFAAALAIAAPGPALFVGKLTLIGLGFLAVYAWDTLGYVMRWIQAAGVWIGIKCTEVSPSLARAFAAVWRGICAVYSKAPVHVYFLAVMVIIGSFVLRRPAGALRRSRPQVDPRDPTRTRKASSTMWVPMARQRLRRQPLGLRRWSSSRSSRSPRCNATSLHRSCVRTPAPYRLRQPPQPSRPWTKTKMAALCQHMREPSTSRKTWTPEWKRTTKRKTSMLRPLTLTTMSLWMRTATYTSPQTQRSSTCIAPLPVAEAASPPPEASGSFLRWTCSRPFPAGRFRRRSTRSRPASSSKPSPSTASRCPSRRSARVPSSPSTASCPAGSDASRTSASAIRTGHPPAALTASW